MSIVEFIRDYNTDCDFLRIHGSKLVNKYMIKSIDRNGRYLVLIVADENGDEIQMDISETYYRGVLEEMKGWY